MAIENRTTPHRVEIVFDHETNEFKGAFFIGIEQTYVDGEKFGAPTQTNAIPLDKALEGGAFPSISEILGGFNTALTAEHAKVIAERDQIKQELEITSDSKAAVERQRDDLLVDRENLLKAARDMQGERDALAQQVTDYAQADRVGEIMATREAAASK